MKLMINEILQNEKVEQKKLLNFFARQPQVNKIEIFELHKKMFYILRQKYQNYELAEISYCALIKAIEIAKNETKMLQNKSFGNMSNEEIKNLSEKQIKIFKTSSRRKSVREQLIKYLPLVISLRSEQISFRKISDFLLENHNIRVSYCLIYKIIKELK